MGINRFKKYNQEYIYINPNTSSYQKTILTSDFAGITYPTVNIHVYQKSLKYDVFEYIQSGRMCIVHDGHKFIANAGDVYILKRGSEIEYYSFGNEKVEKLWFNMEGILIDKLREVYSLNDNVIIATTDAEKIFNDIHLLFQINESSFDSACSMALNIHTLLMKISMSSKKTNLVFEPSCETAVAVKNYIDAKLHYYTTLKSIAKYFFTTDTQIIRLFKAKYGITPYSYMLQKRIIASKKLLSSTKIPIKAIAEKFCFANGGSFTKAFKKHIGLTPSEYRQKVNNKY